MAEYNVKEIAYGGNNYKMYPANLTSDTRLQNAAQDATETQDRVYPVRMDANGKLAVNVPWTDSGGSGPTADITKLKNDLGFVEETDTATHAIAKGQYVIWHGELYKAKAAISVNDALSASNLEAVSGGGFNEIFSRIKTGKVTGTTSNNGILVTTVPFENIVLISCWASNSNSVTPYLQESSGYLGFRLSSTSSGNWTVVGGASRTVYYTYIELPVPSDS